MMGSALGIALEDYNSIINNQPATPGYTALAQQIVAKANGNSSEKQVAIWLRDWYIERVAQFQAVTTEQRQRMINW